MEGSSVTMFCWFWVPVPKLPTEMWNERFCQITLFCICGFENPVQLGCPSGHSIVNPVKLVLSSEELGVLVTPADCGHDVVSPACTQFPGGALATGVPRLCVSTPEEASVSLLTMVLFSMTTLIASCSEIPAPSQPARLLEMMLLVMRTSFQSSDWWGNVETSVPLTCCRRMPPPLPLSAILAWMRLALILRLWPVPSLRPGAQSASICVPQVGSVSGVPMI